MRMGVVCVNDAQLIELFFARSERAITETDRKYGSYCHRIAMNILSNRQDCEECVNDTYLTVWNRIPPLRPISFAPFVGKITRELAIDRWRASHAAKRGGGQMHVAIEELENLIPSGVSLEDTLVQSEMTRWLNAFIRSLSEMERRIFVSRYWYMDSIDSIASRFGVTKSYVKTKLFRIRKKLKAELIQEGWLEA